MISRARFTGCDCLAVTPLVAYAFLACVVWIAYGEFGNWPVNSSADPAGHGFDLTGAGAVILMFWPLVALGVAAFALMAIILSAINEFCESRRSSWPMLARRGLARLAVGLAGFWLLVPVAGRVLRWVLD